MTDRGKIRRLLEQPRWKRTLFVCVLDVLLLWQHAIDYYFFLNFNFLFARRAFVKRTIQRAHWIGAQVSKPHRLAFLALASVLIAGFFVAPTVETSLHWALGWGSLFSLFVIHRSLASILNRITAKKPTNQ